MGCCDVSFRLLLLLLSLGIRFESEVLLEILQVACFFVIWLLGLLASVTVVWNLVRVSWCSLGRVLDVWNHASRKTVC